MPSKTLKIGLLSAFLGAAPTALAVKNSVCPRLLLASVEQAARDHRYLALLSQKQLRDLAAYMATLDTLIVGQQRRSKELGSIEHVRETLIHVTADTKVLDRLGMSPRDIEILRMAIIDSDLGKLASFQNLLKKESTASDRLLDFTRLDASAEQKHRTREIQLLAEFLESIGMEGKTLLPRHLRNDQIRQVFQANPMLLNFLHELPGISLALSNLRWEPDSPKGFEISPEEFKQRLSYNLFHNGPHEGFWAFFRDVLLPQNFVEVGGVGLNEFFRGTVYEGLYPTPANPGLIAHIIGDRLSGATGGGLTKFWWELREKSSPLEIVRGITDSNLEGSRAQMEHTSRIVLDSSMTPSQKQVFENWIDEATARMESFHEALDFRIERNEEDGSLVSLPALGSAPGRGRSILLSHRSTHRLPESGSHPLFEWQFRQIVLAAEDRSLPMRLPDFNLD